MNFVAAVVVRAGLFTTAYIPPVSDTGHYKEVAKLLNVPLLIAPTTRRNWPQEQIETSQLDSLSWSREFLDAYGWLGSVDRAAR